MSRKKRHIATQFELGQAQAPAPAAPAPAPTMAEFELPSLSGPGEIWRVEKWELFRAEFPDVTKEQLPEFHSRISQSPRTFTVVRRLFGIFPLNLPVSGDPEDYRLWNRAELKERIGISDEELNSELEAARFAVRPSPAPTAVTVSPEASPPRELIEEDDRLLHRHGFAESMFNVAGRAPEDRAAEKTWFCARVREWDKLLSDRVAQRLATQALFNEMRLRRSESRLCQLDIDSKDYIRYSRMVSELEESYERQLQSLDECAPWFNVTGKQMNVTGAIAELIRGIQEFQSDGSNKILDGVFTALEIQVLLRSSQQVPTPRYRLGWVTYINESKQWLWNRDAQAQFRPTDLQKLDAGFKEGVRVFTEENGLPVPDLEADGAAGEYEDLHVNAAASPPAAEVEPPDGNSNP